MIACWLSAVALPSPPEQARTLASGSESEQLNRDASFWPGGGLSPDISEQTMAEVTNQGSGQCFGPHGGTCARQATDDSIISLMVPFYEAELCKLKYLLRSIAVHVPRHFAHVHLAWVSPRRIDEFARLPMIMDLANKAARDGATLHDASSETSERAGWIVQQVLKLALSREMPHAEFYVIFDAKNTVMRLPHSFEMFTSCGQARLSGKMPVNKMPQIHRDWYAASAKLLGVTEDISDWNLPLSITPAVFHTQTVRSLLERVSTTARQREEASAHMQKVALNASTSADAPLPQHPQVVHHLREGMSGGAISLLDQREYRNWRLEDERLLRAFNEQATEFTLYNIFALNLAEKQQQCSHAVTDGQEALGFEIWRGQGIGDLQKYAAHFAPGGDRATAPLTFGAQKGALKEAVDAGHTSSSELANLIHRLFDNAGLLRGGEDPDQLMRCIDGGEWDLPGAFVP